MDHAEPTTKGSTLRSTLSYLRREGGEARVAQVLARFPAERRARLEQATRTPTAEVPFRLMSDLLETADALLRDTEPEWVEAAGAYAIESVGLELYPGILRKSSPLEFLTQPISLFRLYYQPGDMEVVEHETGRAVLRLVGFQHRNRLFCRRQTGGLRRALELAGGQGAAVRHVRCAEEGDAFCEWELRWD
jgi:hypothetical protein